MADPFAALKPQDDPFAALPATGDPFADLPGRGDLALGIKPLAANADLSHLLPSAPVVAPDPLDAHAMQPDIAAVPGSLGRHFVGGGGTLLDALAGGEQLVRDHPALMGIYGLLPHGNDAADASIEAVRDYAQAAHQFAGNISDEKGLLAKVAGVAGESAPSLAAALVAPEASVPEITAEAAPTLSKIPGLLKLARTVAAQSPRAAALTGIQAAANPNETPEEAARDLAINAVTFGVPGAVGETPLTRATSGAAIGPAINTGATLASGQTPTFESNIFAALQGALGGGAHEAGAQAHTEPAAARAPAPSVPDKGAAFTDALRKAGFDIPDETRAVPPQKASAPDFSAHAEPIEANSTPQIGQQWNAMASAERAQLLARNGIGAGRAQQAGAQAWTDLDPAMQALFEHRYRGLEPASGEPPPVEESIPYERPSEAVAATPEPEPEPRREYRIVRARNGQPMTDSLGRPLRAPVLDYSRDGLLHWLGLNGGINFDDLRAKADADPASLSDPDVMRPFGRVGWPALRRNGGMTLEEAREKMQQDGWFPQDDPDAPPTLGNDDAAEKILDALNGHPVYHPYEGADERMMREAGEYMNDEAAQQGAQASFADADEAARQEALANVRAADASIKQEDAGDALSVTQWLHRARAAGLSLDDALEVMGSGTMAKRIGRLARAVQDEEANGGLDRPADQEPGQSGLRPESPPVEGARQAAADQGAEAEQQTSSASGASDEAAGDSVRFSRPRTPPSGELFGAPTAADRLRAAQEAKDAQRNGRTGGREPTGGGLFDGERPEQARIAEPKQPDQLFRRPAPPATHTPEQVRATLRGSPLGRAFGKLEGAGALRIESHPDQDWSGYWDGDKAVLNAARAGEEGWLGTAMHELGGHGSLHDMLGDEGFARALSDIRSLADAKGPAGDIVRRAMRRVESADTPARHRDEELLAYTISEAVREGKAWQHGTLNSALVRIFNRIRAWVKTSAIGKLLAKHGVDWKLNPDDIAALAESGIRRMAREASAPAHEPMAEPLFHRGNDGERDLIAQHNTTAEKLAHADRMGGLAVPSIGITRAGHPLQDFGDISLIGDKELVNPHSGAKVFGADAYTPRYPEVRFKTDATVAKNVARIIGKKAGERLEVEFAGSAEDLTHQPAFKRYAEAQLGDGYGYHQARALAEQVLREAGAKEVLFKGFTNMGNRRYAPHTLENVVKELKRNLRGGEGFDYGPGSIRAKYTPQFRSIEAIRDAKGKIVAKEDFEKLKEEVNSDFFAVSNELAPYHARGNDFLFTDAVTQTMQDAARMGIPRALRENGFHDVPQEAQAKLGEFLTHLRNMPTHYFEAILPRAVGIHEFRSAVIPKDTNAATRDLLQRHGLNVHEYDKSVEGDQARAVREAAQNDGLMFSEGGYDQTDTPAFRRWFGDSKVVDENGKPLTIYHGTADGFYAFDNARLGESTAHMTAPLGHFFAEDEGKAQRYAENASRGVPADERVIDAHLSIQDPKTLSLDDLMGIESQDEARALKAKLEAQGYDGIHIPEIGQWIAFDPGQIKSASENVGSFDRGNPDIRFSRPERDKIRGMGISRDNFDDYRLIGKNADGEPEYLVGPRDTKYLERSNEGGETWYVRAGDRSQTTYDSLDDALAQEQFGALSDIRSREAQSLAGLFEQSGIEVDRRDRAGHYWDVSANDGDSEARIRFLKDHAQVDGGGYDAAVGDRVGEAEIDIHFDPSDHILHVDVSPDLPKAFEHVAAVLKERYDGKHVADIANEPPEPLNPGSGGAGGGGIRYSKASANGEQPEHPDPEQVLPRSFASKALSKLVPGLDEVASAVRMAVAPMAEGSVEARATAKDFANRMREARFQGIFADKQLTKHFTREQLERMWNAADEQSVLEQRGEPPEDKGLATLAPDERRAVEILQANARKVFEQARALGMVEGEGLPSYTPRMVVRMGDTGPRPFPNKDNPIAGNVGRNVRTNSPNLRQRLHLTAEETEAAAKAKLGEDAELVRNIRTLPLATSKLAEAVAGRSLINRIRDIGKQTGQDTVREGSAPDDGYRWFTLQHPAFTTWRPRFDTDPESGKVTAVKDANGNTVFDRVPLYVRGDFAGPLKAVLSEKSGPIYNGLMALKGKTMSVIMYSPLIHNAVEWGRALPAMPGKVATFRVYFEGNRAKNDPATMREAINAGLVPIGQHYGFQDISSIQEGPNIISGRSWTAKLLAAVPDLFDKRAGDAVKRAVDKLGDVWHNKLLWDRVGDLQMGLYSNFRDRLIHKGFAPDTAQRMAAHFANRYAGALPMEAMSNAARKIANLLLFSRSFTLGNLGAMKDMVAGLPRDAQSQILRDRGLDELARANSYSKRKAISIIAADIALMYLGNSLLQSGIAVARGSSSLDDEEKGYADRLAKAFERIKENPLALLHPFNLAESLTPMSGNEPGKQDRVLVGHAPDGTAIYMRNPTGKIGEEFEGWLTSPLDMLKRKLGTVARPLYELVTNDKGFGRKVYDPYDDSTAGMIKNAGRIAGLFVQDQVPMQSITAVKNAIEGNGDTTTNVLQAAGPLAGLTFSKGAPGGPAVGIAYQTRDEHDFAVNEAIPGIRDLIRKGDTEGAVEKMRGLGMPPSYIRWVIRTTNNPSLRLSPKGLRDFGRYASPEQQQAMQDALDQQQDQ